MLPESFRFRHTELVRKYVERLSQIQSTWVPSPIMDRPRHMRILVAGGGTRDVVFTLTDVLRQPGLDHVVRGRGGGMTSSASAVSRLEVDSEAVTVCPTRFIGCFIDARTLRLAETPVMPRLHSSSSAIASQESGAMSSQAAGSRKQAHPRAEDSFSSLKEESSPVEQVEATNELVSGVVRGSTML
jgi:hypothetical protein